MYLFFCKDWKEIGFSEGSREPSTLKCLIYGFLGGFCTA